MRQLDAAAALAFPQATATLGAAPSSTAKNSGHVAQDNLRSLAMSTGTAALPGLLPPAPTKPPVQGLDSLAGSLGLGNVAPQATPRSDVGIPINIKIADPDKINQ